MTEPKYRQVKKQLVAELTDIPLGRPIPPERELADQFAVARSTIRKAIAELTAEGRLLRTHGKGTFVTEPQQIQRLPLAMTSYTEFMRGHGRVPSSSLLELRTVPADDELAHRLAVAVGSRVLRIGRLRLADGLPVMVETTHVSLVRFPGLRRYVTPDASLHQILAARFGVELPGAEKSLETALAGPVEARLLDAQVGQPMLVIRRQSFDTHDRPVEWARSILRGDRYKFQHTTDA
ncbi:MAG TPA: GntR family transcriptional regulator [Pseudonocardiaceae bacterium]|nr:GntR family transcriptional regulator [Pseudonocardiaceae bacterium]